MLLLFPGARIGGYRLKQEAVMGPGGGHLLAVIIIVFHRDAPVSGLVD